MRNTRMAGNFAHLQMGMFAILLMGAFCGASFGQRQRVFNWLAANDESVRLDSANYHTGRTYRPGPNGGNNHVDIKAEKPVTIFTAPAVCMFQVYSKPWGVLRAVDSFQIEAGRIAGGVKRDFEMLKEP